MAVNRALLSLGSNIEPELNLPRAARLLSAYGRIGAVSRVWQSAAVGFADQPDFLNGAVLLETACSAEQIIGEVIPAVERAMVRVRDEGNKNAPRTIDVDLAMFNDLHGVVLGHAIPDPEILTRPFLATPLSEIAPAALHAETGETLRQIAASLGGGALRERTDVLLWPPAAVSQA